MVEPEKIIPLLEWETMTCISLGQLKLSQAQLRCSLALMAGLLQRRAAQRSKQDKELSSEVSGLNSASIDFEGLLLDSSTALYLPSLIEVLFCCLFFPCSLMLHF